MEVMGTEVKLPARSPIMVHVSQTYCALLHWVHRLPISGVLTQCVRGGVWYWVRLHCLWWITSKDGPIERKIVQKRIVSSSSSPKHLAKRHLLGLLTKNTKLLGSWIWNGLTSKERHRLLLLNLLTWLSLIPGLEV